MLVLSRKINEKVIISVPPAASVTTVTIAVVEITGGKIRLGFEAPQEVRIDREEVSLKR